MGKFFGLKGKALNTAIGLIAGLDFLLFGFDQGVTGGLLKLDSFQKQFPGINPYQFECPDVPAGEQFTACAQGNQPAYQTYSSYQAIAVASYYLGCFIGATGCIWIGDRLGRKRSIFLGSILMTIGAALQATAFGVPQLIIGRLVNGIGNGMNTATVPMWQSETAPAHHRGPMVMLEGSLSTAGVMISYWLDFGFSFLGGNSVSWRFPLAFQAVFALIILGTVLKLPESPRWLLMKGRKEEATEVLVALRDLSPDSTALQQELIQANDAIAETRNSGFRELFTMQKDTRHFHRVLIAYLTQVFQQISGINLVCIYAPIIYSAIGFNGYMSSLIAAVGGTEYFIASIVAILLIERVGRRPLMLTGAAGMFLAMVALTVATGFSSRGNKAAGWTACVFVFIFNTLFATGWLGIGWLYPAEVVPTRIRAPANALSTSANWMFNFLVVMVSPPLLSAIGHWTYLIFAIINALIIPVVYTFFPETSGRTLEEMDEIFARSGWVSVVKNSKTIMFSSQQNYDVDVSPTSSNESDSTKALSEVKTKESHDA